MQDYLQKTTYLHAKEICKYVKTTYGIDYTVAGMTFWLKKQGFIYKEPIKVPVLAKLGGYLGRNSGPPPGHQVIWRGYIVLQHMCSAFKLIDSLVPP